MKPCEKLLPSVLKMYRRMAYVGLDLRRQLKRINRRQSVSVVEKGQAVDIYDAMRTHTIDPDYRLSFGKLY